jgi:penicillin-binding protein 1A
MNPVTSAPMRTLVKIFRLAAVATLVAFTAGALVLVGGYLHLAPQLPSVDALRDVQLQVPLRVYTRDGALIQEFGEKRRSPARIAEVPDLMVKAFLAAEDDRFFEHPGVDYQGLVRAAVNLIKTGEKAQGGSTITMQVARNFFLSREKTYLRKLSEILLSFKIEHELSKPEILELYLNKIYLGNRAYGVGAAAQVYYGKELYDLTLAEMAMIAGLPKAPSVSNPIASPARAMGRRNYVLGRMQAVGYIDAEQHRAALAEPDSARLHALAIEVEAPHVAEMVRTEMMRRFGEEAYTGGYRVYTTLEARLQRTATAALRTALLEYDRRHGYRGAERRVDLAAHPDSAAWERLLAVPAVGQLVPALVLEVGEQSVTAMRRGGELVELDWAALSWARPYIDENRRGPAPKTAADILSRGDLIRLQALPEGGWRLAQVPAVEGALVALAPRDGAALALVGGFDFAASKFNRVLQAQRQPGSAFKPFVYSAALDKGYTTASLINDAPVVFDDPHLESTWRPGNYSGRFYGPTRLREALVQSRNLVSIRLLQAIEIPYAVRYAARFGFVPRSLPSNLTLALGSGTTTPLEMVTGYAVFANGGHLVTPYYLERIEDASGRLLYRAEPAVVCEACDGDVQQVADAPEGPPAPPRQLAPRVISAQNAFLMTSMMRDVIQRGTGRGALRLGRQDIAGKTGTTNDLRDAWFCGYHEEVVAAAWVGFDRVHPLGDGETGGRAALPMWVDFMRAALEGVPQRPAEQPPGLITVRLDPESGLLAGADVPNAIFETFLAGSAPTQVSGPRPGGGGGAVESPEQLF